jgi:adenylate cyclase
MVVFVKRRIRTPIALKLGTISIGLLLAAMIYTAYSASNLFTDVSSKREEDGNRALADAKANQVNVVLDSLVEKISTFGPLIIKEDSDANQLLSSIFKNKKEFASLRIFSIQEGEPILIKEIVNPEFFKGYDLDSDYLAKVDVDRPFPIKEVFGKKVVVANRSLPKGAPLLTVGVPIVSDDEGAVTHIGVSDVNLSLIQQAFATKSERVTFLIGEKGQVIAHPDEKKIMGLEDLSQLEIVKMAQSQKMTQGQKRYFKKSANDYFISSFTKARFGLTVISESPESAVLAPAARVQSEVYKITGIVLSIAFFIAFVVSLSITKPLRKLIDVTKEIAQGNFDLKVAKMVRSGDEVGLLAGSFDSMLTGLRERDKVKNLFNKFHGSSVTENLLQSDEVEMGGSQKEVVVFFSDIRGFTSMAEEASPEHVVNMMNEYFDIMVPIILKHGGIVDKFIGDAIMAIWGAPTSTGDDANNAVKACIEMRQALAGLNSKRIARGEAPFLIGMGVHTGAAVSGNIGSAERIEFTVIGDTVNMASRIEESTKAFGTDLVISEALAKKVEANFMVKAAGEVKVKGKSEPIHLFYVLGHIHEDGREEVIKTDYSQYDAESGGKAKLL